ncbi:MAG: NAD-dependent succinate-semialdehyde dehydrogenase [Actinobacteria bacterium]|nr:NAD-dependent succinate-semialdehyde dehydrogenase [Actinomycetota bacterium]
MTKISSPTGLLIDGKWITGSNKMDVIDPSSNQVFAQVTDATLAEVDAAIDSASTAFKTWSETAPRVRSEILRKAFEIMSAELEDCARLISLENGKAWRDAMGEAAYAAEFFRWFSEEAVRTPGDFRKSPSGDKTIIVDHRPIGVALMVTPWNFPAAMATRKLGPALAAGCTAILKPPAETPLTALWVADVLQRAGVPAGVVNVVTTSKSSEMVAHALADKRIATLSFTGSTFVGKKLLQLTSQRVMPASMELGGNAPFLVFEGADVDKAVAGAMIAKMRNGGAACTAANRFYIHESVAEEFSKKLASAFSALKIGPGIERENDLGAMVSQKEADKISELLTKAESEGGKVISTAKAPEKGAFVAPVIVEGIQHGSILTREEVFGPVAPIVSFQNQDDAIQMANDTEYGLISYVFAKDAGAGIGIAKQMESGMVAINRGLASDPAAPFGGMKESGIGREGGFHGIHEFLETQYFAVDL